MSNKVIRNYPLFCFLCGKLGQRVQIYVEGFEPETPCNIACDECHMEPDNFAKGGSWVKRCRCDICRHIREEKKR